jgi:L-fuconolactonase
MSIPTEKPEIVDAHVHLWDLALNPAWYPGITGQPVPGEDGGLGDTAGLRRNYLLPEYGSDTSNYRVSGLVHVSATQGPGHYLGETQWVSGVLDQGKRPYALIGAIEPAQPLAAIEAELDALQRCPQLRGVRVAFGLDPAAPGHAHAAAHAG